MQLKVASNARSSGLYLSPYLAYVVLGIKLRFTENSHTCIKDSAGLNDCGVLKCCMFVGRLSGAVILLYSHSLNSHLLLTSAADLTPYDIR